MNKSQYYLSQCADAAAKSTMCFNLGAVLVKGGKIISTGYNHHRPHYDGSEVSKHGHRKPVSMHAEMHAIFSATGMSPAFKTQSQNVERRVPQREKRTGIRPAKGEARGRKKRRGTGSDSCGSRSASPRRSESSRQWSVRRRDPKVNGADLYVARITKHGVGNAKPCWRCIEWCKWAGVKRIFHFVGDAGQFNVVKVNEARSDVTYETHADVRLFAGAYVASSALLALLPPWQLPCTRYDLRV
ncbi:hypothetical protein JB92DRAFT_3083288 [Gautieria morchelliformis]|nr:hypothetical protein JB92DRAFT_3083288 [Gautieria morchelliformis]